MYCIIDLIAWFDDNRQSNCKTAAHPTPGMEQGRWTETAGTVTPAGERLVNQARVILASFSEGPAR
jgi:hypothetical protein